MPVCFELISKETMLAEQLPAVDGKLADAMGEAVHEENWCYDWYNRLGVVLACGKDWDYCRELFETEPEHEMHRVIDWLEANYDVCSWRE